MPEPHHVAFDELVRFTASVELAMTEWQKQLARTVLGPDWTPPGYLGRRCGWYPKKPRRSRA